MYLIAIKYKCNVIDLNSDVDNFNDQNVNPFVKASITCYIPQVKILRPKKLSI